MIEDACDPAVVGASRSPARLHVVVSQQVG